MSKTKAAKAQGKQIEAWDIHLANGDWFARLSFRNAAQVRRLFPRCKIKGDQVFLPQP